MQPVWFAVRGSASAGAEIRDCLWFREERCKRSISSQRSAIGKRKGGFAGLHPAALLGAVQRAAVERARVDARDIG
jgi:hypothetical protein